MAELLDIVSAIVLAVAFIGVVIAVTLAVFGGHR